MLVELAFSQNANTRNYLMKNILLSSAAVFAFAGAAAADGHLGVTFSGDANLGYNTSDNAPFAEDDNEGFYSELDVTLGFAAELDNGLVAAASIDLEDLAGGAGDDGAEYELSLTSDMAGLYYGDTNFAAQNVWVSAGDMESDFFSEADGEEALRGEVTFGMVSAQVSYALSNANGTRVGLVSDGDLDQLSIGASADLGNFNVVLAYQEASGVVDGAHFTSNGDFNEGEVFGLSVGTSFAGADIRVAYAQTDDNVGDGTGTDEDSMGIKVAYPFGPVTATAYYVAESEAAGDNYGVNFAYENGPIGVALDYQDDQGTIKVGLEGTYDVGNGIMAYAGYLTEDGTDDRFYVAGTYDLGSGASVLVSYASDDSNVDEDEIGAGEYQDGTTVELSFAF
jgi:outer membrane protein OmpU